MKYNLKQLGYSRLIKRINVIFLSFFYDRYYLTGKFFDEQRYGFVWAWKGLPRARKNRKHGICWPTSKMCRIANGRNISVDPSSLIIFQQPGTYFQAYHGQIVIGKDVWIAQNVGLITENHNPANPDEHLPAKDIVISDHCWIGMNAVILPGVVLGPYTTVGAGAIVTKSFPEGHCIIGGNPARIIKKIEV